MKLISHKFVCENSQDRITIIPLGDLHVGALNCAEEKIRSVVKQIQESPNTYWIGGGDMCDAVLMQDAKRFDPSGLPAWMLHGAAVEIRDRLEDMLNAQKGRLFQLLDPIKDKCLGLIEGNHEYSIMKYHNRNFMSEICDHFGVENLTDCAFVRFQFTRKLNTKSKSPGAVVSMFITHGNGGGRTAGAEPNSLYRLAADKDVDIILRGHSHSYCILPPIPMLGVPTNGMLPDEPAVHDKHVANWGSYLYTYKAGPSTYASRANYPTRPMYSVRIDITPFATPSAKNPRITMSELRA